MNNPPHWITSISIDSDKEWLFLDSTVPTSSAVLGLSWGNKPFCLGSSNDSFPVAVVEIEPAERWTPLNTLEVAHQKGFGTDWSIQNRFNAMRSGMACDKDIDGSIHILQCNVAGDIFTQHLNVNEETGARQQKTSANFVNWLTEWIDAVEENEETSLSPGHVDQTERYIANGILEGSVT